MKKILLLLIMLVNLQVVIRCNYIGMDCGLTASAQHMTREAGDNCFDEEVGLWYYVSNLSWCHNGPEIWGYPCQYCHQANDSEVDRKFHEWCCPENPQNQPPWEQEDPWLNYWEDSGSSSATGTSYNAGGGGGSRGGNTGGNGTSTSESYGRFSPNTVLFYNFLLCRDLKSFYQQHGNECMLACIANAKILLEIISGEKGFASEIERLKSEYKEHYGGKKDYGSANLTWKDQKIILDELKKHQSQEIKKIITPHKEDGNAVFGQGVIACVETAVYDEKQVIITRNGTGTRTVTVTDVSSIDTVVLAKKLTNKGTHAVLIVGIEQGGKSSRYAIINPWGYCQTIPINAVSYSDINYGGVYTIQ